MIIDVSNTLPIFQFEQTDKIEEKNREYIHLFAPRWANLVGWTKEDLSKSWNNIL